VVTAPSYAVASLLRTRPWRPRWGRSLVVGVPDETAPAVASEAEEAAGALPGAELLIGCEGTVANVVTGTAEPIDVLHLACHGIHRPRNPMFSALKLSDRWLTAQDVMDLSLPGALVVLSACESGRSDPGRHREETIGLARSFVAAGAAAVVVSLWITADRVAADTMRYFYRALATAPPAAALRIARTAVAGDHPHPADWGPFIIHGGQRERP
jgi:CHAT domain-containing protein